MTNISIGAFEAKTHFSSLLEKVRQGRSITITKHGQAVAQLIPTEKKQATTIYQTIQALQEMSQKLKLGKLDWKNLRDEGRRS